MLLQRILKHLVGSQVAAPTAGLTMASPSAAVSPTSGNTLTLSFCVSRLSPTVTHDYPRVRPIDLQTLGAHHPFLHPHLAGNVVKDETVADNIAGKVGCRKKGDAHRVSYLSID